MIVVCTALTVQYSGVQWCSVCSGRESCVGAAGGVQSCLASSRQHYELSSERERESSCVSSLHCLSSTPEIQWVRRYS